MAGGEEEKGRRDEQVVFRSSSARALNDSGCSIAGLNFKLNLMPKKIMNNFTNFP